MAFGLEFGRRCSRCHSALWKEGAKGKRRSLVPASTHALFQVPGTQPWPPQHTLPCSWGASEKGTGQGTDDRWSEMTSVVGCDRKELALLGKVCKMVGAARGQNKLMEQTSRQIRGGRWLRGQ